MEFKKKQAYKPFCSFTVSLILLCVLTLSAMCICVSASDQDVNFLVENYNITEQYSSRLSDEIGNYSAIDDSADKSVSKAAVAVVNLYRKQLLDLQSHPEVSLRSLAREAELAYQKGCAAGRLAWIYNYNLPRLSLENSKNIVGTLYSQYLAEIDASADSAVLAARADAICSKMNTGLYREMLNELRLETDSLSASSIIVGGIDDLSGIVSYDLFGSEHAELYFRVVRLLFLQRSRDDLAAQAESLFAIIRPGENYTANHSVALFSYKLKNADNVRAMNEAAITLFDELLPNDEMQVYICLYVSDLKNRIADIAQKASLDGKAASFAPAFDNYTIALGRASAKDNISESIYSQMDPTEANAMKISEEFNSEGGRIDSCNTKRELEIEIIRARHMIASCKDMLDTLDKIKIVLQPYDTSAYITKADEIYCRALEVLRALYENVEFEKACRAVTTDFKKKFSTLLDEAKAERFLSDFRDLISKPGEELTTSSELEARRALNDYMKLEPTVKSMLSSQINSIAEKYNIILCIKIRSLVDKDALYLDLCETFCSELKKLSKDNIESYYNNCDLICKKADTLRELFVAYRAVCSGELYVLFNSGERESLTFVCRDTAKRLSALNVNDKAMFEEDIKSILADAKVELHRINEQVRLRVAARDSVNTQIKTILSQTTAKIKSSYNITEITSLTDKAIFKINRLLTSDAVKSKSEALKYSVNSMKFIDSATRADLISKIDALAKSLCDDALSSENLTVLSFVWNEFCNNIGELETSALTNDLEGARKEYLKISESERLSTFDKLNQMSHLKPEEDNEFYEKINSIFIRFKSEITTVQSSGAVKSLYEQSLVNIDSLLVAARETNLANYKVVVSSALENLKGTQSDYSEANYNRILQIIAEAKEGLITLGSIDKCSALLEEAEHKISLINNLLDDARDKALSDIDMSFEKYKSKAPLYSSAALEKLERIVAEAKQKLSEFKLIGDIPALESYAQSVLDNLKNVRRDYITNAPSGITFVADGTRYPNGYDIGNGLWGLIHMPDALPSDSVLQISAVRDESLKKLEKLIRKAAKSGNMKGSGEISQAVLKQIKKCDIALGFDISVSNIATAFSDCELQLLLPQELEAENILGVVFVDDNGNVEFYTVKQKDMLLSLSLNHFSSYYVIVENTVNLMPLIIFLTILIFIEFVTLIFILILRFNRKRKDDNMIPLLSLFPIAPFTSFSLSRIKPTGAVTTTVLLTVAVLALGCTVALLARLELKDRRSLRLVKPNGERNDPTDRQRSERVLSSANDTPMLGAKKQRLKAAAATAEDPYYVEGGTRSAVGTIEKEDGIDDDMIEILDTVPDNLSDDSYRNAKHKAEINLDVIEAAFSEGDLVTLDAMKRKHLIPKKTDYIKVLARGALSKPLIIEAHDFSRAAEEMLLAVGGEAIRIKH